MKKFRIRTRIVFAAFIIIMILPITLTGCTLPFQSSGATTTASTIRIEQNAANKMVNDSLILTVTGVQRRPLSVFQGSSTEGSSSSSSIKSIENSNIVIEIDMSIEFNMLTLTQSAPDVNEPSTLKDLLLPGTLMMIQGKDANGGDYLTYEVITPDAEKGTNIAASSVWNYDLLNSDLPQTSQVQSGSILFSVSPTASDLNLVIVTADGSDAPLDAEEVQNGNKKIYILPLS